MAYRGMKLRVGRHCPLHSLIDIFLWRLELGVDRKPKDLQVNGKLSRRPDWVNFTPLIINLVREWF
jgi:hypothetical protein